MILNIQIDLIMWKTDDEQFTLTTKKSLHITFKVELKKSSFQYVNAHLLLKELPVVSVRGPGRHLTT